MTSGINDFFKEAFNSANPNVARVTSTRSALGTSLSCDNLAGWPTDTAVDFSTYKIDTSNAVIPGTQIDWKGLVAGNSIGTLTRITGAADTGSAIGDVVEMNPTGNWATDLVKGILTEHNQDGTHKDIVANSLTVATSVSTDVVSEKTSANGVTVDGLNIKDGVLNTNNSVVAANIATGAVEQTKLNLSAVPSVDANGWSNYGYFWVKSVSFSNATSVSSQSNLAVDLTSSFSTPVGGATPTVSNTVVKDILVTDGSFSSWLIPTTLSTAFNLNYINYRSAGAGNIGTRRVTAVVYK